MDSRKPEDAAYVMDQQWVRIGESDSSPPARNVRRAGMVVRRAVDSGGERQYGAEGAEDHGPAAAAASWRPLR